MKLLPKDFDESNSTSKQVVYVLGGAPNELRQRFKTAADLYKKNISRKILVLSDPGITGYDSVLGRNLTNNEWAIKRLEEFGVKKEDIELLSLDKGFFGTRREAKSVSQFILTRGYNCLILVTSPYHTARVWLSFSKVLADHKIDIFVYKSDDETTLRGLLFEYFKLILYKEILL